MAKLSSAPISQQKGSLLTTSISITTNTDNTNNSNNGSTIVSATDSDGDGLTDIQEIDIFRTNMNKSDSDGDMLSDGKEVNGWYWFEEEQRGCNNATPTVACLVHKTNPLSPDTDGDVNSDYYEYITFGSIPIDPDQDKDNLMDGLESGPSAIYHTSFFAADTDKDGFSDGQELEMVGRDPNRPDSQGRANGEDDGMAIEDGINNAPIANALRVVTLKNDPVEITLTGIDKDSDRLYFFIATHPRHGTLSSLMITGSASAKLTFTPQPNYVGEDRFTFWAYDGKTYSSSPSRVLIYISPQ